MGRHGLPSFLLDTKMDEKWELLEARFGLKGFAIAVKLLQRIYGGEGYYCEWNEDISLVFAKSVGADASLVSDIVDYLVKRGLFDNEKFSNLGILTSTAIQKNYLQTKRRAIEVVLEGSFLCANFSKDVYKNLKIVYRNKKNDDSFSTSKVNEIKVNESKSNINSSNLLDSSKGNENQNNTDQQPAPSTSTTTILFDLFEEEFGRPLTQREMQALSDWCKRYDLRMVKYALKEACLYNRRNIDYIHSVLQTWTSKRFTPENIESGEYLFKNRNR